MISVDVDKCVGCGWCITFCPSEALKAWGCLEIDYEKCTECYCCIQNCPVDALQVGESQADKCHVSHE